MPFFFWVSFGRRDKTAAPITLAVISGQRLARRHAHWREN
jgi:hypothetical protein